jgi:hypothetical protein
MLVHADLDAVLKQEMAQFVGDREPLPLLRLAEARMKSVGDACFSLLFAGSMSPF